MSKRFIFSSESVGEGHPDKVCDTISDAVLDACLAQDKHSRVACECYAKSNLVVVGGEITSRATLDFVAIARETIREIGYVNDDDVFHADRVFVNTFVTKQSPDIAQGVDALAAEISEDTAAVIMETIPETAGMLIPPHEYYPEVRKLCDQYGAQFIADEVQSGMGRTGRMWAIDEWNVVPDILVTGKGLSAD